MCEAAGLKTVDRKRKVVKSIGRILGERPLMEHAGTNVSLTVTSAALTLTTLEAGHVVASHDMPNISFASGGDPVSVLFLEKRMSYFKIFLPRIPSILSLMWRRTIASAVRVSS